MAAAAGAGAAEGEAPDDGADAAPPPPVALPLDAPAPPPTEDTGVDGGAGAPSRTVRLIVWVCVDAGAAVSSAGGGELPAAIATAARTPSPASVPPVAMCVLSRLMAAPSPSGRQPPANLGQSLRKASPGAASPTDTLARMAAPTRILLVEDEASIAEPFAKLLRREGFDPIVAATAADALDFRRRYEPDLVLLDLALPDGDGRDVCRAMRSESDVPVIMVTARGTETDRVVGLEIGADDYVVKPFSGAEVIARIRAVLRRTRAAAEGPGAAPAAPLAFGDLRVDLAARRVHLDGSGVDLSRKEFDLLAELARNAGRVVRREDLMARVWDENWFGSTKTLDVHIGWLRRKLGDDPAAPRFIETVRGVGFRFALPIEEPSP